MRSAWPNIERYTTREPVRRRGEKKARRIVVVVVVAVYQYVYLCVYVYTIIHTRKCTTRRYKKKEARDEWNEQRTSLLLKSVATHIRKSAKKRACVRCAIIHHRREPTRLSTCESERQSITAAAAAAAKVWEPAPTEKRRALQLCVYIYIEKGRKSRRST